MERIDRDMWSVYTDETRDANEWRMSHVRAIKRVYLVVDFDKTFGVTIELPVCAFGTREAARNFINATGWDDRVIKEMELMDDKWIEVES
jgi:hypothetical protein